MNVDSIKNGIVIYHIEAGKGMEIYNLLKLDSLNCSVAIIKNASSNKMGKKDIIKKLPLIAKAMQKLYGLFIDRENDREAAKTIIEAIRTLKEQKASIGLFPEGYTSKTCELLPFRNGSFKIALKSKSPIVVCVLNNTRTLPKRIDK